MNTTTDITIEPNFQTKEEYLAFVKEWKTTYKQLSIDIRQFKLDYKEIIRNRNSEIISPKALAAQKRSFSTMKLWEYVWAREQQKQQATALLKLRAEAKIIAGQQYLEHRKIVH